jgi:hypothetical protein
MSKSNKSLERKNELERVFRVLVHNPEHLLNDRDVFRGRTVRVSGGSEAAI